MNNKITRFHILLFLLTLYSVTLMGVYFDPDYGDLPISTIVFSFRLLLYGLPFSLSLLFIISLHELGHLLGAKKHSIDTTMPFFIPAPPFITLGTFGAFIKIKSPIPNRRCLVDTASYGPIFGFLASLFVMVAGFILYFEGYKSPVDFGLNFRLPFIMTTFKYLFFGEFKIENIIFENPLIASAYIGFFVQGLNLLFVGQLDGGHLLYSIFPKKHKLIGTFLTFLFVLLTPFGFQFFLWAVIFYFLGIKHPPTLNDDIPLKKREKLLVFISFLIFLLSFQPQPFVN